MYIFKIHPSKKTLRWLKDLKIDYTALGSALTCLFNDIHSYKKYKKVTLSLQVDYKNDASTYIFGTNKIYLCNDPDYLAKSRKQKVFVIFLHLLHEFRHWMQSQILHVKDKELRYSDDDVEKNNKTYRMNKYEVDARKFEKKYVRRFMQYYVTFKSYGQ